MLVMVLTDLSAICKKLTENSAVPEELRVRAREFVTEFDTLLQAGGKGTAGQHFQGEESLIKITRFLPRVLEVQAEPATVPKGVIIRILPLAVVRTKRLVCSVTMESTSLTVWQLQKSIFSRTLLISQ